MLFTLDEIMSWIGITAFELFIHLAALTFTTMLTALCIEIDVITVHYIDPNAIWSVMFPLFAGDVLAAYFCTIVFVRTVLERTFKVAVFRAMWSFSLIGVLLGFKIMLCNNITGKNRWDYSEVFSPLLLIMQLIAVRACQAHG